MAEEKTARKPVFELHLLNDDMKKHVIECIQKRGKIAILVDAGTVKPTGELNGGFTQVD